MNDLISRRALCEYALNQKDKCITPNDIMRFPSVQPEPKWIPVRERLPEGQTEVIVSCMDNSGDTEFLYTSSGWMTTDREYWIVDNEINSFVIAWMPMPEPYKKKKGEPNE